MASKGPKKKESKDQVGAGQKDSTQGPTVPTVDEKGSAKKKPSIPLWPEWSDQDIINEKWDLGKKEKERGRSPNAAQHYFEDPEGYIDIPLSLKGKVHTWKRPIDIIPDEVVPVVVSPSHVNDSHLDILTPNEHITSSEVICSILSSITTLYHFFAPNPQSPCSSFSKFKSTIPTKETKDSKAEKNKKDAEVVEEIPWKPWDLIWPKENVKTNSLPIVSSCGKYAVKLYWMGSFRKIIVDDTIPCDADMKPLLPFTKIGRELWLLLITKALIKVASLDYFGDKESSEMGDVSFVHCLTGWIPEQIPLENVYKDKIWKLLLNLLPNWKLPQPPAPPNDASVADIKSVQPQCENVSKQELNAKESKEKNKKDEKAKEEKKVKPVEKSELKSIGKDKAATPNVSCKQDRLPEYLLFASFNGAPIDPFQRFVDMKREASASEKLRQFGLTRNLPHPVHISVVRNCPLIPPPTPIQIPRWKLIRQKKKKETSEPSLHPKEIKEPKFVELKTPFLNFKFTPTPASSATRCSSKFERNKQPMCSVGEETTESLDGEVVDAFSPSTPSPPSVVSKDEEPPISSSTSDVRERTLSFDSQISVAASAHPKSPKQSKSRNSSSREMKKSILKERKSNNESINSEQSQIEGALSEKPLSPVDGNAITEDIGGSELPTDQETIPECGENNKEKDQMKDFWMELEDFFECFNSLWIYHKVKTHSKNIIDTKVFDRTERGKKGSGHNLGSTGRSAILSPTSCLYGGGMLTEAPPPYLMVDCLKQTEVLITLHSFSRWFDPYLNVNCMKDGKIDREILKTLATPVPGSLVLEPYSWKNISSMSPTLKIRTSAIKSVTLTLPPGRHVLRLMITAPLGYNVNVCSSHPFVFGDENSIMQALTNESLRFIEHSVDVVRQIMNIMQNVISPTNATTCNLLIGTENKPYITRVEHFEALFKSLSVVLKKEMGANYQPLTAHALEVLKHKAYLSLIKINKKSKKRPSSTPVTTEKPGKFRTVQRVSLPAIHLTFDSTEDRAATKIQACFKRFYTMKLNKACTAGTPENVSAVEHFNKIYQHIEANTEDFAVASHRHMFTENPSLFKMFPFYADDWNKISYIDYIGNYPEQPADCWFLICRDIFYVEESFLVLPKFYCNVPGCHLIVVNNDNCQEVKTVFRRVIPQVLSMNKSGYSFVVVAFTENVVPAGKYKLRLMGERDPLPFPPKEGVINSNFFCNETRDYYIPNRYNRIFRYTLNTTEDALGSIHFSTSKDDVYIKLQILDHDEVLYENEGKKHVTVPAFLFYKDQVIGGDDKKSSRPTSRTGSGRSSAKASSLNKRPPSSRKSASPEKSKSKINENKVPESIDEESKTHKYTIQGYVLRDSWPLSKKQWDFVETLKNTEEEEVPTELAPKPENNGKNSAGKTRNKGGNAKDAKGTRSRPESQTQNVFDTLQPHWNLKVFVDANLENAVEIKRDTEREDQIKSIKKAWETHEPGRAAKAQHSRAKYLETHTIKHLVVDSVEDEAASEEIDVEGNDDVKDDKEEGKQPEVDETTSSISTLSEADSGELYIERPPKKTDIVLKQLDVTPFIRSSGKPVYLDTEKEEDLRLELEQRFQEFQEVREMMLNLREEDRNTRNTAKENQIQKYEEMQLKLDSAREAIFKRRDEYRSKFLPKTDVENIEVDGDKKRRTPSPKRKPSKVAKSPSKTKKK